MNRSQRLPLLPRRVFAAASATVVIAACFGLAPARAADPVQASINVSTGSALSVASTAGVLVVGSLATLQLAGEAVVASVETIGDTSLVVLRGVGSASANVASATIQVAGGVGVAVGTVVQVVAMQTGGALMAAGQMIAFVPNQAGRDLIHQSRTTATR